MSPQRRVTGQILLLTFLLVVIFVGASIVYAQLGFSDLATAALGAATAIAGGGGASSIVVHRGGGTPPNVDDESEPPA